jgi:hypothetical protein
VDVEAEKHECYHTYAMQRKLFFIIGLSGIIIAFFVVFRFVVLGRTPKQGLLKISTNVSARVLVDNREIGRTPFEQKLSAGEYALKLIPESTDNTISSWQGKVTIGPNVLTYVNRDLSESELTSAGEMLWLEAITSRKSEMTILSVPEGANVLLDDQSKGVSPISLTDLTAGDHTVIVNSPGFEPRTIKVKLTAGYKLNASVSLALSPTQVSAAISGEMPVASDSADLLPTGTTAPSPKASLTPTKTPTPTPDQTTPKKVKILDTPTGFLRVRKEPNLNGEELAQVKPGEIYVVVGAQPGWYKISYTETDDGWISSQYAQKAE